MCCLPTTFTSSVSVMVQGINVSANTQKCLIVASKEARHYESVICNLKLAMMKWKFLKDLDLKLTELEDKKKQGGPDVPAMNIKDQ